MCSETFPRSGRIRRISAICIIEWLQSCGEGEPECAEGGENYRWKGVAQDEFKEASENHEHAAEEEEDSTMKCQSCVEGDEEGLRGGCTISTCTSKAHEIT